MMHALNGMLVKGPQRGAGIEGYTDHTWFRIIQQLSQSTSMLTNHHRSRVTQGIDRINPYPRIRMVKQVRQCRHRRLADGA